VEEGEGDRWDEEEELDRLLAAGGRGWLGQVRERVMGLKKRRAMRLRRVAQWRAALVLGEERRRAQVVEDLAGDQGGVRTVRELKRERSEVVWQVEFKNPGFDKLGLAGLVREESIQKLVPPWFREKWPSVVYSYVHPIRKEVLNYKKVLEETQGQSLEEISCSCGEDHRGRWRHEGLGHVVTGDLGIVRDDRLRELLERGPKYRERREVEWEEVEREVEGTIDGMLERWGGREGVAQEGLAEWREAVRERVRKKVARLRAEPAVRQKERVLESREGKRALEELQREFVLVSADKSENNVVVVCRRHYVQRLREELESVDEQGKRTYEETGVRVEETVEKQIAAVEKFGLKVEEAHHKLATLYWTAKMHKEPPKERFIAASSKCVTKVLSQQLSKCLKQVQEEMKRVCEQERRESRSKVSKFWVVESTDEVVSKIGLVNGRGAARSVDSFDFSTLYTKLQHRELRGVRE